MANSYGGIYIEPETNISSNYANYMSRDVTYGDNGYLYFQDGSVEKIKVHRRQGKFTLDRPELEYYGFELTLSKYSTKDHDGDHIDDYVLVFIFKNGPLEVAFCDMGQVSHSIKMTELLWKYEQEGRECVAFGIISSIVDDPQHFHRFLTVMSYKECLLFDNNFLDLFI